MQHLAWDWATSDGHTTEIHGHTVTEHDAREALQSYLNAHGLKPLAINDYDSATNPDVKVLIAVI